MSKKFLFALFTLFFVLSNANATEIATLKLEDIIKNSTAMVKAGKEIETKKNEIQKRLEKEEKKLTEERTDLEGQVKVLEPSKAQEKVQQFQDKVNKFQIEVRENEQMLQQANIDVVNQIIANIKTILKDMKDEKDSKYKFDVVLPTSGVVYSDVDLDLSGEVISRLNKKYKEVKVDFATKKK
jgi:Skp family chaperone for outer membrane proteins